MKGNELFFGDYTNEFKQLLTRDSLLFIMFCVVLVCEDPFLRDIGLSVEGLFGRWLGNPSNGNVTYHIRRSQVSYSKEGCNKAKAVLLG